MLIYTFLAFAMQPDAVLEGEMAEPANSDSPATAMAEQPSDPALALREVEPPAKIFIPRDTPVLLMVLNEVSTKDHAAGHLFRLRVHEPVMVDGEVAIPVGTVAWGELLDAKKSGNVGKSGKLSARLLHLEFNGREIPLDGDAFSEGKSGKGETILGVLGMGPLALFAKGNNAKLKAGDKITGFVAQDVLESDPNDTAG